MKKIIKLISTIVLPLTIILFGTITKWRYVTVEDGPNDFLYGFPYASMCRGWHTSLSMQIFVSELLINFLVYFAFCLAVIVLVDKYLKPLIIKKIWQIGLYSFAIIILALYGYLFSNPNNVFLIKRDFNYKEIQSGYKFIWQQNKY